MRQCCGGNLLTQKSVAKIRVSVTSPAPLSSWSTGTSDAGCIVTLTNQQLGAQSVDRGSSRLANVGFLEKSRRAR